MRIEVLPLNETASTLYENHGTFHAGDSGLDVFIVEEVTVNPGQTVFIKLGIKAAAFNESTGKPVSYFLLPRSSISKTPLRLANSIGLIDAGYRGEIMAAVDNIKNEPFTVKSGERYFQIVSFGGEEISMSVVDQLDATARGEGGFGSTEEKRQKLLTPVDPTAVSGA
jgi:dUTP pyrophosphatase